MSMIHTNYLPYLFNADVLHYRPLIPPPFSTSPILLLRTNDKLPLISYTQRISLVSMWFPRLLSIGERNPSPRHLLRHFLIHLTQILIQVHEQEGCVKQMSRQSPQGRSVSECVPPFEVVEE